MDCISFQVALRELDFLFVLQSLQFLVLKSGRKISEYSGIILIEVILYNKLIKIQ